MKKVAATLAISALAATGAEAEDKRRPRVAPESVYNIAPGLGIFTDEVLFGDIWTRADLAPRDRSLITVAALVATGKTAQVGHHVGRALDNGVKPEEIGELITQLAFYTGWPNAMTAVTETKKIFDERKIGPVEGSDATRLELDPEAEAARRDTVQANVEPTAPALAELTNRVLFGDLWTRPDLSARDRSLVTMAALIAIGQPEQLPFHANRAMDNGLRRTEVAEVATHLGFYAGWPRAMSAVPVLERVFASRAAASGNTSADLKVIRANSTPATGSSDYFSGEVQISGHYQGQAPARIGGATVSFAAGARTAWHTHPLGQTLYIVSGRGWVQKAGGPATAIGPGDVVWIPPSVKHWHGASATEPMTHFAVAEALNGVAVTWMEKVTDEHYLAGQATD
ncbi:carboxymuconolactone decarboxylase family protein [Ensifer adhaerens]|uniref:(R)-mandelonitrile lyase n=1 Tax=Ensifer adhaerens TaxID=106592 RepID=UPI001CBFF7BD|nr:carboxymuconolactone decarboxylase family protein [Ensifer adhaerens]MBZ7926272.1 carboxymuconolactone decarboxylase family protein [Ensifer adhaerens]UAX97367.1 carboxymuconolactone decarboxylase family protein [Ensifer adhaerens]UAY03514.1 carboxymuconolactone decarboxylase family protein [Ensifer adhaerens]UAY11498.1 carboxymuconolactone decarboxylase family protein [Ensifer adhaerens]